MEKEEPAKKEITATPIVHLVLSGINSTLEFLNGQKEQVGPEKVFEAFASGVKAAVAKVGYGLHALSPKQEKYLAVLDTAQRQIEAAGKQDELELKLIAVPKRVEGGLVGADGKPLTKDTGKLLVT